MKLRKRLSIVGLCLLSATVVVVTMRAHSNAVLAAQNHTNRAALAQPATYLPNAAMRNAAMAGAMMLDDDGSPLRVSGNLNGRRPLLPPVEEFTLTPPNPEKGINKTTLSVKFDGAQAEKLASQLPMTLGTQHVVMQRSSDDPAVFSAQVDFDWQTFAKEQELRKEAAAKGRTVSMFDGRQFIGKEPMQFLEPSQILSALQTHQPIQFSGDLLAGSPVDVFPDHELLMNAIAIVGAQGSNGNTFDPCLPSGSQGNPNGAWTFNILMQAIACSGPNNPCASGNGQQVAEAMLQGMLSNFNQTNLHVNGFFVPQRPGIGNPSTPGQGTGLMANWPEDGSTGLPSLPAAPVHLNAIVNRIDLGSNTIPATPGELRFVFGVTAAANPPQTQCSNDGANLFNIILEYNVPSNTFTASQWANLWNNLPNDDQGVFGPTYLPDLLAITNDVVLQNKCVDSNQNPISCLAQIRTNEIELGAGGLTAGLWEQRQFTLGTNGSQPVINEGTISMTPDGGFNFGQVKCGIQNVNTCTAGTLSSYINTNSSQIVFEKGVLPNVPNNWPSNGPAFLGGSAFNTGIPADAFWVDDQADGFTITNETARIYFSQNTCNGCHGAETATAHFQQVVNRAVTQNQNDSPSALSNFLLGCTDGTCQNQTQCQLSQLNLGESPGPACTEQVKDPNCNPSTGQNCGNTTFGDLARRVAYLQSVLGNDPGAGGMLLPFIQQPIGVH